MPDPSPHRLPDPALGVDVRDLQVSLEGRLADLRADAADVAGALDPDSAMALDVAVDQPLTVLLADVQCTIDALTGLQAALVRAAQLAGTHRRAGASGVPAWVTSVTGASRGRSSRLARVAGTLEDLPRTADAFVRGQVDLDRADAIARAARRGRLGDATAVEDRLLDGAVGSDATAFRGLVDRTEQAVDGRALARDADRARTLRELHFFPPRGGLVEFRGALDVEAAEEWRTALDALERPDPEGTPDELRRSGPRRMADALVDLARLALQDGLVPKVGGVRPHVSVVIDAADLGDPDGGGAGTTGFGQLLDPHAVRRILCDADVTRIVMSGPSEVLDVGRATQIWNAAQRRALVARDGGCRGPDCDRPAGWCHAHHLRWWKRDRGPTSVDNGILVCDAHHGLVHDDGWEVEVDPDTAEVTWTPPDDRPAVVTRPHRPPGRSRLRPAA